MIRDAHCTAVKRQGEVLYSNTWNERCHRRCHHRSISALAGVALLYLALLSTAALEVGIVVLLPLSNMCFPVIVLTMSLCLTQVRMPKWRNDGDSELVLQMVVLNFVFTALPTYYITSLAHAVFHSSSHSSLGHVLRSFRSRLS